MAAISNSFHIYTPSEIERHSLTPQQLATKIDLKYLITMVDDAILGLTLNRSIKEQLKKNYTILTRDGVPLSKKVSETYELSSNKEIFELNTEFKTKLAKLQEILPTEVNWRRILYPVATMGGSFLLGNLFPIVRMPLRCISSLYALATGGSAVYHGFNSPMSATPELAWFHMERWVPPIDLLPPLEPTPPPPPPPPPPPGPTGPAGPIGPGYWA